MSWFDDNEDEAQDRDCDCLGIFHIAGCQYGSADALFDDPEEDVFDDDEQEDEPPTGDGLLVSDTLNPKNHVLDYDFDPED